MIASNKIRHLNLTMKVLTVWKSKRLKKGENFPQIAHKRSLSLPISWTSFVTDLFKKDSIFDTVSFFWVLYVLYAYIALAFSHIRLAKAWGRTPFSLGQKLLNPLIGQCISQFISWMAIMTPDPMPRNIVAWEEGVEFLP